MAKYTFSTCRYAGGFACAALIAAILAGCSPGNDGPDTMGVYVVVLADGAERSSGVESLPLSGISVGITEEISVSGTWDACEGGGGASDLVPGASVDLVGGTTRTLPGVANPTPVYPTELRNVDEETLGDIVADALAWREHLDDLMEEEGAIPSSVPVASVDDLRAELEELAASGEACLLVATAPYEEVEFLNAELPAGLSVGMSGDQLGHNGGWIGVVISSQ